MGGVEEVVSALSGASRAPHSNKRTIWVAQSSDHLRILSIGAHPADIFDQSGGVMAHHAARGDYVACVVLTHGARVHDKVISDSMFHLERVPTGSELLELMVKRSDLKAQEVRKACDILGFQDVYFFGEDDAVLLMTDDIVRRLAAMIRALKPDIVLTHFPREGDAFSNPHAIAGQITLYAIGYAATVDSTDSSPPHRVAQVFFFGTGAAATRRELWDAEGGYYNDVFIDITDVIEKKLAAMDCLASQGYGGAYTRKRIETSDGAFGQAGGVSYGEGFISLYAETHYLLPVTDYALKRARSSDLEIMAAYSYRVKTD
jgi:4-oxalomesaconate hydratase